VGWCLAKFFMPDLFESAVRVPFFDRQVLHACNSGAGF
jgi:hypothetical protein